MLGYNQMCSRLCKKLDVKTLVMVLLSELILAFPPGARRSGSPQKRMIRWFRRTPSEAEQLVTGESSYRSGSGLFLGSNHDHHRYCYVCCCFLRCEPQQV
mmetsp:Transcript_9750/g.18470  ORF Transcript_9750/g.18470 Transcript_9750/m.18470 type:complete len:100 (-) Transcript_9750:62-361(-)